MTPGRLIYKTLLQISKQYRSTGLPLTGVVGFSESRFRYPLAQRLKEAFTVQQNNPDLDSGFRAIKQLQAQYGVLSEAGPVEQVSYAIWQQSLLQSSQHPQTPHSANEAVIWGSFVASKMLRHPHPEEEFDDSSLRDLHQACSAAHTSKAYVDKHVVSGWSGVSKKLKGLAEEVQQGAPADLFDTAAANQQPPSSDTQMQQLQQIVKTLFHKGRFRQEPYEWVYDGLKPLDIMDVLQTQKGISLSLSVIFLGVARQLGIPMSMVPIPEAPVPELAIPDNIRRRQATQTIATAPEPSAWLLRTEWPAQFAADAQRQRSAPLPDSSSNSMQQWFVDPLKGSVMSQADCQKRYLHMKMDIPWLWDVSLVSVLAEFARVAVTAHQRRGESDAVAFWIYQLMALDTMAPEWQHVMPQ